MFIISKIHYYVVKILFLNDLEKFGKYKKVNNLKIIIKINVQSQFPNSALIKLFAVEIII